MLNIDSCQGDQRTPGQVAPVWRRRLEKCEETPTSRQPSLVPPDSIGLQ